MGVTSFEELREQVEKLKHSCGVHCPHYRKIHQNFGVCKITGILKLKGSRCTEVDFFER